MKSAKNLAIVILAAGLGTRMQSPTSKVLHQVGGKTILERTLLILGSINAAQIIIVVNESNFKKIQELTRYNFTYVLQPKQLGTGDALKIALKKVNKNAKDLLVLYGDDNIFYKVSTIEKAYQNHIKNKQDITFITVEVKNSKGFGRVVIRNKIVRIVEEKDATESEKKINQINDGVYFFNRKFLESRIKKIAPSKKTGELYITDLVALTQKVKAYLLSDQNQYFAITTQDDLQKAQELFKKRVHIMGIRGAGASAVAQIAKNQGFIVDGCDLQDKSAYDENLKDISIEKGHDSSHIANISKLIMSPAVLKLSSGNTELKHTKKQKIKICTWQKFQGEILQKDKFVITVAGAYGKSTTTAMIASILVDAGLDPTCEIGAKVLNWGKNYQIGQSKYYVCEADEYQDSFLNYKSDIAVILNMDWDHPDYFKDTRELKSSYIKFINRIKPNGRLITTDEIANFTQKYGKKDTKIIKIVSFPNTKLSIIGDFRKVNANAALTVAKTLKIDIDTAQKSITNFKGVGRRLEFKGSIKGTSFFDDYAVQPYTIKST